MRTHAPTVTAGVRYDGPETLLPWLHAQTLLARGHRHVVHRTFVRPTGDGTEDVAETILPPGARVLRTCRSSRDTQLLAEVGRALVLLELEPFVTTLVVSASRERTAVGVADDLTERLPPPPPVADGPVDVVFTDRESGLRSVSLELQPWDSCRDYYTPEVTAALDALVAHRPEVGSARRLLLWHGAPGTGKTSAARALLHAWREWAAPVVVTDPEVLLSSGGYLRTLLLDMDDDEEGDGRWQLLVLEDAEALLRKDTGGPAMSRLLNLTDGLLGQGLRCLFLITTNEPLAAVHPAVVRPGRCLAQVEFGALPAAQAAELLGRPVPGPMTLAEVLGSRPVESRVAAPEAVGQYL